MLNPLMALTHSWEDRDVVQDFLAGQLLKGRVALILGSGVSAPFGLPSWENLINKIYQQKGLTPEPELTLAQQAEVFKVTHCRKDPVEYASEVKRALYEGVNIDFWTLKPLLAAIGALVMASKRGSASTIVTFNFDDILEMYLEFHGFVSTSIVSDRSWSDNADVRIFHPHGLLPFRPGTPSNIDIVLDQASFSSVLRGDRGRLWRDTLMTIMRSHLCLFVGLSGSDPHLESLLSECRTEHASLAEGLAFWGLRFTDSSNLSWRTLWAERGVSTWVVTDYDRALPEFLLEICQRAARLRARSV
jgi:hypothetical protein